MTSEEFSHSLKVPKERIAVLIGEKGKTKRLLEKKGDMRLDIDSVEGEVVVFADDALKLFVGKEMVRAIARGFNPEVAMLLEKQDYGMEVLEIPARTKNDALRLRGRLIGENGKSRKVIEELTGCFMSVYGKTVSILGEFDHLRDARKAIEMLMQGANHASVYRLLERKRRQSPAGF